MNNFNKEESDCHILDEGFTAKDILDQKINEVSSDDGKGAFYVTDLRDILKKHLRWLKALSYVTPFYDVKCSDSRAIVNTLAAIGTGFHCTSKTEIQLVQSLGVPPERIIYANSSKQVSQIKYAVSNGVQMMTFDSEVELMKVAKAHPKAKLVLWIATDASKAVCCLSVKFGATVKTSKLLLEWAKQLNIDVIGVSFHAGSGCTVLETFVQAVSDASCVFDMGAEVGFSMYLLDIGGGFPGSEDTKLKFEEITSVINPALDKYFPSDCGMRIIAEPGTYYVSSSIWGPMCDDLDWITELLFENMGAYTVAARPTIYYVMSRSVWQLMKHIQNHDFLLEIEEQDISTVPMSCAQESRLDHHPAACASTSINV
uniref:Ornithine decarboxylase n=1 Tax=Nannospalax galili TaxID=1026970 RepID=A0A8C6R126_NANGA